MKLNTMSARLGVVAVASTLVLAACGGDDGCDGGSGGSGGTDSTSEGGSSEGAQLYFVDGNTADYSQDFDPGTLAGVRATYPGAELGDAFKDRMLEVNPKLKDFTYGP